MAHHILTADDSGSVRMMIRFSLEMEGHRVSEAENGETALALLKTERPDMLITDLDMPKMNGFDLVRHVRAMSEYRRLPIIVLTTESNEDIKRKAREAGASGWITKPFRPYQIAAIVGRFLGTGDP
jgi:two-component system chemotaxis response regulator CheY